MPVFKDLFSLKLIYLLYINLLDKLLYMVSTFD